AAWFGVGAYTTAILAKQYGLPAEVVLPASAVLTALLAVLGSVPTRKLTGHTGVIATLALGHIIYLAFLTWIPVTRGPMGIPGIPAPEFALGGRVPLWDLQHQYWLALAVLTLGTLWALRMLRSPVGRAWRAIREDRLAAHAAG